MRLPKLRKQLKKAFCIAAALTITSLPLMVSPTQALANPICRTDAECQQIINNQNSELAEMREEDAELQAELRRIESKIEALLIRIAGYESRISEIQADITRIQGEIEELEREIAELEEKIQTSLIELAETDLRIEEITELIGDRMVAIQRTLHVNPMLDFLIESENLIDLIRRMRLISQFAQTDSQIFEELQELFTRQQQILENLQSHQASLAANEAELALEQEQLAQEEEALQLQQYELGKQQIALDAERTVFSDYRNQLARDMLTAEEIAAVALAQQNFLNSPPPPASSGGGNSNSSGGSSNSSSPNITGGGGNFIIPLETGRVICEFGNSCYVGHFGIDLGNNGDTSTRVLAAAAGTVVHSGWSNSFGWWVAIAHNFGGSQYTTVYAHMHQRPLVNAGSSVYQGQHIGFLGRTGWIFGGNGHLHFEVHRGAFSSRGGVNPRNYIHFPSSW